jgi:hypothetical protein
LVAATQALQPDTASLARKTRILHPANHAL